MRAFIHLWCSVEIMASDHASLTDNSQRLLDNIRIVLVNTSHPGNIGGVARAMKNMGLTQLYLVEPKDYPSPQAQWRAANAMDVLEGATVVATLDEAISDCGLVVGTSARERRIPWPLFTPRECGERAIDEASEHPIAIIFGREDRGLTNEELHKCHYHVHIPTNPDYSSLNLAAAVQVLTYELRMSCLEMQNSGKALHFNDWDMPPAKLDAVENYYTHLQETLESLGFIKPNNPRQTMTRLRRLYNRVRLDEMEVAIMRGMLTSIQNYIFHTDNKIKRLSGENDDAGDSDRSQ
jgi:tRNA (cytidine32/uridine32-2'-O)-methyltransferase